MDDPAPDLTAEADRLARMGAQTGDERLMRAAALSAMSALGGEADEIGQKADIAARRSALWGRADVPAKCPESLDVAINRLIRTNFFGVRLIIGTDFMGGLDG